MTTTRLPLLALLTGAGISTDSGIPDYRGPQGVWRRDPEAERLVTYEDYVGDPDVRRRAWRLRLGHPPRAAEPNAAHRAIVDLERAGAPLRVLTQNVDGPHQRAGLAPRTVFELHGSAHRTACVRCHARRPMEEALARVAAGEPDPSRATCGGVLKPATVMCGEALDPQVLARAVAVTKAADVFLAVGTTLQVHPVAGLVELAVRHGARFLVVNAEPTPYDHLASEVVREPIGTALPELLERIGGRATA
ncbi:SIR2 family NAD-dependent protein deacylase [Streptomyces sp. CA-253872]|uniref:SIR2 family NAD-dependent protein deacylase n=1 Tax=Streptomyces sp. CA-253872 TaxID=3240067 RepID=UPI003D933679